jgi:ArsR family transcriptional regulator
VKLVQVYRCLCDLRRLRILHLLVETPLCVCHLQSILDESQVKVSQQLAFLKKGGLVQSERKGTWMIYRLPKDRSPLLEAQLKCLQDCVQTDPVFRRDRLKLKQLLAKIDPESSPLRGCCSPQIKTLVNPSNRKKQPV